MINTLFSGDEIPKERTNYICISTICINSILRIIKKISTSLFRTM